jgi:bifunctional UDP-N-acetylglucosamine pyrophosphorylase / glucosamine-1-phosphate N-acetyltransferase
MTVHQNPSPLDVVVLAAGKGTRMRSALPKVLQPLGGAPLLGHVLNAVAALSPQAVQVVVGHGREAVAAWAERAGLPDTWQWVTQTEQLGTGHAVAMAQPHWDDHATVLITYGDVPLIDPRTLQQAVDLAGDALVLVSVRVDDPTGYGRIVRDGDGAVQAIVEHADASAAQRAITEINTGIIAAPAAWLGSWLARLSNDNPKGEYYLTDVVAMAVSEGRPVDALTAPHAAEFEGVNDRTQLARTERLLQQQRAAALMSTGVTLADPQRIDIRGRLEVGRDVFIDVGCVFEGRVVLGDGVRVGPYCLLRDVTLGAGSDVASHSVLEGVQAGEAVHIGPFARLRPGTELGARAKVGNFVETKKAVVGEGSKVNHLSYVGDARLGNGVNVGAGTITCNYDGVNKHLTVIGDGAFIGSNSALVAPVTVGEGATIGAGSVIGKDAPAGQLTVSRARQVSLPGWKRPTKKPL